ncbi:CapA family protein [Nocardioides sp. SYSU D00038]|uniref:CapA family protein n=1 Tax=Nocardioides sp. SYSU D00038 TaxID=2812554 RepID=UPI001966DF2D|nr:CapA family protein [Nocardioides sp. SYSU D00038]
MRWPTGLALALLLAACSTDERPAPEPTPSVSASPTSGPQQAPAPPAPELVVVGHATRPQLDLTRAQAAAVAAGEVRRVAGRRVVGSMRAVERDPGAVAAVSLDEVGPTVVVARVGGVDPVRDRPDAVRLTVVGDVMLTRGVRDPAAALAPLRRLLRSADLTVGNLESTLSVRGAPTQGGDSFGGTPALLGPLADAGFDALSLANNHAGDHGTGALLDTVAELRASPVVPFGAGRDDRAAARPAVLRAGGTTYAFVGFNAIGETPRAERGTPGALSVRMPPRTGPLVRSDLRRVQRAIRAAGRRADVVVVLPHWGTQYTHAPEPVQRRVSRALVAAGADLVVGGHPHWVQGLDVVAGVPVVHSLGNFVFDMDFMEQTMEGVVLETTWWGEDLKALRFVPYRMDPATFAPRRARAPVAAGILADLWGSSTGPFAPSDG